MRRLAAFLCCVLMLICVRRAQAQQPAPATSPAPAVRLVKGLSLNFFVTGSRIRDQLNIQKDEQTPEEILLQQRQRLTGFRYTASVGLSYTFGSIFNNVVNPRFGGSSGGIIFF